MSCTFTVIDIYMMHDTNPLPFEVTESEILEEINRDRSNEWTDYNKADWIEGMYEFTTWRLIDNNGSIIINKNKYKQETSNE